MNSRKPSYQSGLGRRRWFPFRVTQRGDYGTDSLGRDIACRIEIFDQSGGGSLIEFRSCGHKFDEPQELITRKAELKGMFAYLVDGWRDLAGSAFRRDL